MSHELTIEPVPGLPHQLPPGEKLLWQGRPDWRALSRSAFHLRGLAIYFAVFIVARGVAHLLDGKGVLAALLASLTVLPLAAAALLLLTVLAWLNARSTVYTITSKRVAMRFGIAFPMTFNFPFRRIAEAGLKARTGGEGDIALLLSGPGRVAYLHLWPHARPFQIKRAQPMLRAIPEAARVATLLADAVADWNAAQGAPAVALRPQDGPAVAALPPPAHVESGPRAAAGNA